MPRHKYADPEPKTDVEVVMQALIEKIKRKPPTEELVPLVQAWAKVMMVNARIDKADFMSGFDDDDPPSLPIVKPPQ
jgi:hypothetical protein